MFAIGDCDHDGNQDGRVNYAEFVSAHFPIAAVGLNPYGKKFTTEEINSMFAMADINADGEINYTFKHIDSNGDVGICQQEPWEILTKMEESASLSLSRS